MSNTTLSFDLVERLNWVHARRVQLEGEIKDPNRSEGERVAIRSQIASYTAEMTAVLQLMNPRPPASDSSNPPNPVITNDAGVVASDDLLQECVWPPLDRPVWLRTHHGTHVRAHPGGEGSRVDLQSKQPQGWERMVLLHLGEGHVAIRTEHLTYLRGHPGGLGAKVDTQTSIGPWERWRVEAVPGKVPKFRFQSCHGTWLRASPGGEGAKLDLQPQAPREWEQFEIVSPDGIRPGLKADAFLHELPAEPRPRAVVGHIVGNAHSFCGVTRHAATVMVPVFRSVVVDAPQRYADPIRLRSAHGTSIRIHPDVAGDRVDLHAGGESPWQMLELVPIAGDPSRVAIRSAVHGTYLRAIPGTHGANVDVQTRIGRWEQWTVIGVDGSCGESTGLRRVVLRSWHNTDLHALPGNDGAKLVLFAQDDGQQPVPASVFTIERFAVVSDEECHGQNKDLDWSTDWCDDEWR